MLLKRFKSMAIGYSYALLKNQADAEDAAQEAFLEAFSNLDKLKNDKAFPGFLKTIIFKQCDRIRRKSDNKIINESLINVAQSSLAEKNAINRTLKEEISNNLESLPSGLKEVIILFYIKDYTISDIAAFLDIPASTIKKRLYDGRLKLKERILKMVAENLNGIVPDEIFDQKVINSMLEKPDLVRKESNLIYSTYQKLKNSLKGYKFVDTKVELNKNSFLVKSEKVEDFYHKNETELLRTSTILHAIWFVACSPPYE